MVRLSKPARRRSVSRKRPTLPGTKGGKVVSPVRFHENAVSGEAALSVFIPKIA